MLYDSLICQREFYMTNDSNIQQDNTEELQKTEQEDTPIQNKWKTIAEETTEESDVNETHNDSATPVPEVPQENETIEELPQSLELQEALEQIKKLEKELQYAQADMQNMLRKHKRALEEKQKYGVEHIVKEFIIPTMDILTASHLAKNFKQLQEGNTRTLKYCIDHMKSFGLITMNIQKDSDFDPNIHSAVSTINTQEQTQDGKIANVLQEGYKLHDRIIRPAMVVVYKMQEENFDDKS